MKLEEGMYVRTKEFGIGKIIKIEPFMKEYTHIYLDTEKGDITYQTANKIFKVNSPESIVKSSYNIIDLIEEGDYVNGFRVDIIEKGQLLTASWYDGFPSNLCSCNEEIKSIVTKEQFENMEYKL